MGFYIYIYIERAGCFMMVPCRSSPMSGKMCRNGASNGGRTSDLYEPSSKLRQGAEKGGLYRRVL